MLSYGKGAKIILSTASSNVDSDSVNFNSERFSSILPDRWNNIIFIARSRTFQTLCPVVVEGCSNPADGD